MVCDCLVPWVDSVSHCKQALHQRELAQLIALLIPT